MSQTLSSDSTELYFPTQFTPLDFAWHKTNNPKKENKMPIRFMRLYQKDLSVRYNSETDEPYIHTTKRPTALLGIDVDETTQEIFYTVAGLSPSEKQFNMALARKIVLGRMAKNPYILPLGGEIHRYTITGMVVQDIVDQVVDARARKAKPVFRNNVYRAAKQWLKDNPKYDQITPLDVVSETAIIIDESAAAELAYASATND